MATELQQETVTFSIFSKNDMILAYIKTPLLFQTE